MQRPHWSPRAPVVFDARDQIEIQFPDSFVKLRDESALPARPPLLYGSEQSPVLLWRWSADRQGLTVTKRVVEIAGGKAERFECSSESDEGHDRALDFLIARGPSAVMEPFSLGPHFQSRAIGQTEHGHWSSPARRCSRGIDGDAPGFPSLFTCGTGWLARRIGAWPFQVGSTSCSPAHDRCGSTRPPLL